jgi:hypothetical protein
MGARDGYTQPVGRTSRQSFLGLSHEHKTHKTLKTPPTRKSSEKKRSQLPQDGFLLVPPHPMYTRKFYATGSATGNGVATITVPTRGRIVGVQWALRMDSITDNANLVAELSLASATEIAVNAAQQCISEVQALSNFVTSGLFIHGINLFCPVNVPVNQGQIVYLHVTVSGTLTYTGGGVIHVL